MWAIMQDERPGDSLRESSGEKDESGKALKKLKKPNTKFSV